MCVVPHLFQVLFYSIFRYFPVIFLFMTTRLAKIMERTLAGAFIHSKIHPIEFESPLSTAAGIWNVLGVAC